MTSQSRRPSAISRQTEQNRVWKSQNDVRPHQIDSNWGVEKKQHSLPPDFRVSHLEEAGHFSDSFKLKSRY